jgi:uncharacterized membrane protein
MAGSHLEQGRHVSERDGRRSGPLRAGVLDVPTYGGCVVGLLFWWASLPPTLIPRPWGAQAVVSGVCLAVGYGIGTAFGIGVDGLLRRLQRSPGPGARRWWWIALIAVSEVVFVVGGIFWLHWQNEQRELMGMPGVDWGQTALMLLLSAVVGVVLVIVGRSVRNGYRAVSRRVRRRLPEPIAHPLTVALLVALVAVLFGGAAFRGLSAGANAMYAPQNDETSADITRPTSPYVSGSPESLVSWESLGRTGRDFVATATSVDSLAEFNGAQRRPIEPVRVYVGVQSADTLAERADLAVRELERTGGFDRAVLVVWVPTGSGWVISESAEAIEQLYNGDTAIAAIQYSFLPSLISVFTESGLAIDAGAALLDAVEERWSELPPDDRPKLLLFGKSLGTAGVEAPFAAADAESSLANLAARIDGALIVGPKHDNPIYAQLTDDRDAGSPVWQPVVGDGQEVRFLTRDPRQPALNARWGPPRIVYLLHPSDPVSFWGLDALWRPPEWMDEPRGYDVPDAARWFPLVSGAQAVSDLIYQLSPPPGFGHDFSTDYVTGWAEVAPPDGWTSADTDRLETFLDHGGDGESEH